ncbi:7005_t:CDS:2 [Cetraspora pellucida]|uniref:7005_t:CDS:1 n=1 Tax=Cetraspora pellucida TaxID=1433469 RepID=A0A9N9JFH2_9GLOM|nr:7005_t:CDS:2 [Cetraspora pellucida]
MSSYSPLSSITSIMTTTMSATTTQIQQHSKSLYKSKRSSLKSIQKQQEENVAILASTKEDSPIYMEINSVMSEIEKFRARLHDLSRIQEKRYDDDSISDSRNYDEYNETSEMMMQAVQNQLAVVRQHITSILDNYESLDENLLTVIMTYNEEVNIALQEALQEVPSLYQNQPLFQPEQNSQQIFEAQAIQIHFLEKANFNNIFQLVTDIERCQDILANFTKLIDIDINLNNSKDLLRKYDCRTQLDLHDWSKQFLCGLLQRHIIDSILEHSDIYFNGTLQNTLKQSKRDSFLKRNPPQRLNPEVYAVLGSKDYDGFDHPFIEFVSEKVINIMDTFCNIKSSEMLKKINDTASEVVYSVINVFYFRMQAQEPVSQYQWIDCGAKFDSETMKSIWDTKFDDLTIDICYFPIIGRKLRNQQKLKVYTKAKVLPYRKQLPVSLEKLPG